MNLVEIYNKTGQGRFAWLKKIKTKDNIFSIGGVNQKGFIPPPVRIETPEEFIREFGTPQPSPLVRPTAEWILDQSRVRIGDFPQRDPYSGTMRITDHTEIIEAPLSTPRTGDSLEELLWPRVIY